MSREITPNELKRFFPGASESTRRSNKATEAGPQSAVRDQPVHQEESPEPEHLVQDESVGSLQGEEGDADGASGRDSDGQGRISVTITCLLTRPLDPDNACVKHLLDGLRYSGFLFEDRPQDIDLRIRQIKVATLKEEGTRVKIAPIQTP